ncbi:hypothetical protein SAMN05216436_10965 [bacterium A37T11]|nr:hypothetical protein SAMN05216436_10965 [bacterium A37T11]
MEKIRPVYIRLLTIYLLLSGTSLAFAQRAYRHEIGIKNDNDVYLLISQDQYYTNGVQFYWRQAFDSTKLSSQLLNGSYEISFGQNIYNSNSAQIKWLGDVDRPITGYLFANASVNKFYSNGTMFRLGAEFGMIGPAALGKPIQQSFHDIFGLYPTAGWEFQLRSAVGVDVQASFLHTLFRNSSQSFDVALQYDGSLGFNHTGLLASPIIRLGNINPWHQSAYTNSRITSGIHGAKREFFLYYTPQLHYVVYDATIQGGFFLNNKGPVSGRPETWQLAHQVGLIYARNHITFNLHYIFQSREIKTMYYRHQYGSVSFMYQY